MSGSLLRAGVAVLVSVAAGCTHWSGDLESLLDESGRDFKRDPSAVYVGVTLPELSAQPSAYKSSEVWFDAIFDRKDEDVFVAAYSIFVPEDYRAFSLWPLGLQLWEADDRKKSLPTFYLRKDNPEVADLQAAERYSVVRVYGRVSGDFEGLPFVDVHYFDVIKSPVYTDGAIADLAAGFREAVEKRPATAIERLEHALKGTLPDSARAVCHAELGRLLEMRGDYAAAIRHYDYALDYAPGHAPAQEGLARARKALERQRAVEEGRKP
jgi:tetratricopeptide (TPR) repeat protein